jgi:hypothetical protein
VGRPDAPRGPRRSAIACEAGDWAHDEDDARLLTQTLVVEPVAAHLWLTG